jgi:hypothetical protein
MFKVGLGHPRMWLIVLAVHTATMPAAFAMQNTQAAEHLPPSPLINQYIAAIFNDVMPRWHPTPGLVGDCTVKVIQKPGGTVLEATVLPGCPFDELDKQRMVEAVMEASPLPYQGFESVFRGTIDMVFRPVSDDTGAAHCQPGPPYKRCELAEVDELLKRMDAAQAQSQAVQLSIHYREAIQQAVASQFVGPDTMPQTPCVVRVVQATGGWVSKVSVDPACPYDTAARRAVEDAVLRAQPFPYKGFESVFSSHYEFLFDPNFRGMSK